MYCVEVWGGASDAALACLSSLQNGFFRVVGGGNDDIRPDYGAMGLMPLPDIYKYFTGVKKFKYFTLNQSIYLKI